MPYKDRNKQLEYLKNWRKKHSEYKKEWRKNNRDKYLNYIKKCKKNPKVKTRRRQHDRKNYLKVGSKTIYVNKRPYNGRCEICLKTLKQLGHKRLNYHHWDDKNPSKGIWVCYFCHQVCHVVERKDINKAEKYLELKEQIEKQHCSDQESTFYYQYNR